MTLSEMRRLLQSHGLQLTKSLGQNFLHDGNQLRRIAAAAELGPADHVIEIGPGLGPLTELLLASGARVLAVEKDERLTALLQDRFASQPQLNLIHADALAYLASSARNWADWKLVANLPYSVASPILVEFSLHDACPQRLVVTVQREVAQRLAAGAGSRDYGILSLLIQLRYEPKSSFRISASCFFPAPRVDSTCITLVRRPAELLPPAERPRFCRIVKHAFSERRKMILKRLRAEWPQADLPALFAQLGIHPQARAEHVTLLQYCALAHHLP